MIKRIIILLVYSSLIHLCYAQDTIRISSFGLYPDTRENATPFVRKAIDSCENRDNVVLLFEKGRYDFWPQHSIEKEYYESNTTDNNPKRLAILLENRRHMTLDGGGAVFMMHDRIQPITVEACEDVLLKNLTIDWEIPLMGQAVVTEVAADYFEVEIDPCQYPFIVENKEIKFVGEGWKSTIRKMMEFDAETHIIQQGDDALGKDWRNHEAIKLNERQVRFLKKGGFARFPAKGNVIVFRHSARDHAGVFIVDSKRVSLSDVVVHHTAGLGVLGQYSEDIDFHRVRFIPNAVRGRYFSGHDDGFHLMGCKGQITVDSCEWEGLMDDPVNVHGTCVKIIKLLPSGQLVCRFMEKQSQGLNWAVPGDKVGLINTKSLHTEEYNEVVSFEKLSVTDFMLSFAHPFKQLEVGMALENLSWTPDVTIRNSRFGSCRARGLLITTPGRVVVENNVFESSGSAILIAGDANQWFETGAVKDVLIKGNVFTSSCLSSMYQFTEGIISILPEIPEPDPALPYHRNIRIEHNEFHPFDYPILFARSVEGLSFNQNVIRRSIGLSPFHKRKAGISLEACKKVEIKDNWVDEDVLGKQITFFNMSSKEIKLIQPDKVLYINKSPQ